jgi:hypothetical protein
MDKVIECLKLNDAMTPINLLLNGRRELEQRFGASVHSRSMYRDVLFLAFAALGRDQIDHGETKSLRR